MQLKQKIIQDIFNNVNEFQINNFIIDKYRDYIYDKQGEYLIGGEEISQWIGKAIDLIVNNK